MAIHDIVVDGFGDTSVNGTYTYTGTFNGQNAYEKGDTHFIFYADKLLPYTNTYGYFIFRKYNLCLF